MSSTVVRSSVPFLCLSVLVVADTRTRRLDSRSLVTSSRVLPPLRERSTASRGGGATQHPPAPRTGHSICILRVAVTCRPEPSDSSLISVASNHLAVSQMHMTRSLQCKRRPCGAAMAWHARSTSTRQQQRRRRRDDAVVVAGITRRPSFSCFEIFFYIKIKMEEEHCFGNVTALRFGVVRLWELLARPAVAPGEHRHRPKAMSVSTSKAYSRP